jgi:hypothetical protein
MKEKIIQFIVWRLPPRFLLWAVIRGFADATTGKNGSKDINKIKYKDVYDAIYEKYNLKK